VLFFLVLERRDDMRAAGRTAGAAARRAGLKAPPDSGARMKHPPPGGEAMAMKIFVNLAVKDLATSIAFFKRLGFTFNPQFTDKTAACMVVTDDIYAMLLTHPKFKEFTQNDIADAHKTREVLTRLSFDSVDKVNEVVDTAVAAGGTEAREPQDYGFMYGRSFNDRDDVAWHLGEARAILGPEPEPAIEAEAERPRAEAAESV
jgi:predicted lactoylglutathione lyase